MLLLSPGGTHLSHRAIKPWWSLLKNSRKSMSLKQTLVVSKGYKESQSHNIICLAVLLAEAAAKHEGYKQKIETVLIPVKPYI